MATPYDHHHQHESQSSSVVVVMVPLPLQSHLNQLLLFSYVVSSYKIPVHYAASAHHNSQVKSRASNSLHDLAKIHFHDLPIQFSDPTAFFEIVARLRQPIAALLRSLSLTAKRLVVIFDDSMASVVQDVVSLPNAEAYAFTCCSALYNLAYQREVFGPNDIVLTKDLPTWESCFPWVIVREFLAYELQQAMKFRAGGIYNSSKAIEGSFLEQLLANENISGRKKMWAVGPLHQTTAFNDELRDQDKCLFEWLDKQEPNGVLYISFGTTVTFPDEEIKELALGLEQSGVKFIWVLRDIDTEERRPQLPDGFEERMKEMGMVVREWAPQIKILGHPSIGGFMSHCGWNSCMESISMGVPIAAWPMHSDQPFNALLVTKVLKVGVAVMQWSQREELVTSSMISKAVKKLMASDEGDEIRKRVVEMGEAVKRSVAEGGDCRLEWDSFIAHITR